MAIHAHSTPAPTRRPPPDLAVIRGLVEARIVRDLAFLDLLDGNPDLEPDACAEASLQPSSIRGGARAAA